MVINHFSKMRFLGSTAKNVINVINVSIVDFFLNKFYVMVATFIKITKALTFDSKAHTFADYIIDENLSILLSNVHNQYGNLTH